MSVPPSGWTHPPMHKHVWNKEGKCQIFPPCGFTRLKGGLLRKPTTSVYAECRCDCHPTLDRPRASWRVQHASRGYPKYTIPAMYSLCHMCYNETRKADGATSFLRYVVGGERKGSVTNAEHRALSEAKEPKAQPEPEETELAKRLRDRSES